MCIVACAFTLLDRCEQVDAGEDFLQSWKQSLLAVDPGEGATRLELSFGVLGYFNI